MSQKNAVLLESNNKQIFIAEMLRFFFFSVIIFFIIAESSAALAVVHQTVSDTLCCAVKLSGRKTLPVLVANKQSHTGLSMANKWDKQEEKQN